MKHENATVMTFQDYSASVARKLKSFDEVKKRLRSILADYRQIYPALLKVTHCRSTKIFKDVAEVKGFIESLE